MWLLTCSGRVMTTARFSGWRQVIDLIQSAVRTFRSGESIMEINCYHAWPKERKAARKKAREDAVAAVRAKKEMRQLNKMMGIKNEDEDEEEERPVIESSSDDSDEEDDGAHLDSDDEDDEDDDDEEDEEDQEEEEVAEGGQQ